MNNNLLFLDLYKRLEMFLDGKYHYAESPIKEHIHHLERSMVKQDIEKAAIFDFLRTIRNHMVHRNISPYLTITDETIEFLRKEIKSFEDPISASDIMIPLKHVYYVYLTDNTIDVLDEIYKNSYDLLPVLNDKDQVIGIFSLEVLLKKIYQYRSDNLDRESTLEDFKDLIDLNDQIKERFEFVSDDTSLDELVSLFNKKEEKKLKMLFVTSYGNKKNPLLGIITPHDIINHQ